MNIQNELLKLTLSRSRAIKCMLQSLLIVITFNNEVAFAENDFAKFKKQQQSEMTEFNNRKQADYTDYREQYLAEYDVYRGEIMKFWRVPEQHSIQEDIIYTQDKQTRIKVDAVSGGVTIEHLTDNAIDGAQLVKKLKQDSNTRELVILVGEQELKSQLTQQAKAPVSQPELSIPETEVIINQQIKAQEQQILSQLDMQKDLLLAQDEKDVKDSKRIEQVVPNKQEMNNIANNEQKVAQVQKHTKQRINAAEKQRVTQAKKNPKYKKVQVSKLQLPEDYLYKISKNYLRFYQLQATQYSQPLSLLLAISYAESSFDPKAKSHIPAYGLMQIVPSSAGVDVARKIHRKDQAPSSQELFNPSFNISYGAGYLSILNDRYLNGIQDPLSRQYCVIAAYNTGAGNVAKTFNGGNNRSVNQAYAIINSLTPEQVYQKLVNDLPYSETQKYLVKVKDLERRYQTQIKQWNL
ncbi:transglycosylase SLT domain-containing protein [Shewanella goraebulensis]|uniref:transglycosylase SLT domain-containing protein n=1 Tax=Shewanella goraebulensis TaxID=3050637 RepID=UPI00254CFA6C|nr:transglycosylase SLT domain-containing protein [Shewanella goraebulensis]